MAASRQPVLSAGGRPELIPASKHQPDAPAKESAGDEWTPCLANALPRRGAAAVRRFLCRRRCPSLARQAVIRQAGGHLNPRCDEPRCSRIQAYFTATPARNTPWLFLGFRAPSRPAAARRARRSRRSRERVVLTDHEPNRILFELFRKHPPLPRHFDLGMTHPSDLLGGPLSGPRRYPRILGHRTQVRGLDVENWL